MIYIQIGKNSNHIGFPHHFDCACAAYGAIDLGLDFRLVTIEDVQGGKYDLLIKKHLFVGSVEFMREVFKRAGKTDVRLKHNSNRPHKIITLDEAHAIVKEGKKIFIKPVELKLFTGLVLDQMIQTSLKGLPGDTQVMAYDPFEYKILTEWRVYVHKHKIIDARNYSGDFKLPVEWFYAEHVIEKYKNDMPVAYTIDMAVLKGEYHEVIEFNDMWAIGNYGMPNDLYVMALRDRYFEIINS